MKKVIIAIMAVILMIGIAFTAFIIGANHDWSLTIGDEETRLNNSVTYVED